MPDVFYALNYLKLHKGLGEFQVAQLRTDLTGQYEKEAAAEE